MRLKFLLYMFSTGILLSIFLSIHSNQIFAFNTPHCIFSKILNSDGIPPNQATLEAHAYITTRPNEILDISSTGCGYDVFFDDGLLWFEVGNYLSPWAIGENVRIIVIDNLLYETGEMNLVLDSSGHQHISDMYLSYGDHIGPIASNVLVDGTSYVFIPEGTESIILTATLDDTISGNSTIQGAEFFVDTDPGFGFGKAMNPEDGSFNGPVEEVTTLVDTSSWKEGSTHTIYVRGQDSAGNWGTTHSASAEITPATYQFLGFLPPIKTEGTSVFKQGRTVPVKFQLKEASGTFAYGGMALLTLQRYEDDVPFGQPFNATSSGNSNNGNEFRYETEDEQYIYNLSTEPLLVGDYKLIVTMDNGDIYEVFIRLR